MAENEILDLGGRRWQRTRAALANASLSVTTIQRNDADMRRKSLPRWAI